MLSSIVRCLQLCAVQNKYNFPGIAELFAEWGYALQARCKSYTCNLARSMGLQYNFLGVYHRYQDHSCILMCLMQH